MSAQAQNNKLLKIIEDNSAEVLQRFGIQPPVAKDIVKALVTENRRKLEGVRVDFSHINKAERQALKSKIRQQFNGRNLSRLAVEHGISERTVRRIVRRREDNEKPC